MIQLGSSGFASAFLVLLLLRGGVLGCTAQLPSLEECQAQEEPDQLCQAVLARASLLDGGADGVEGVDELDGLDADLVEGLAGGLGEGRPADGLGPDAAEGLAVLDPLGLGSGALEGGEGAESDEDAAAPEGQDEGDAGADALDSKAEGQEDSLGRGDGAAGEGASAAADDESGDDESGDDEEPPSNPGCPDFDEDTVCDWDDTCPGYDDTVDVDGDGVPDACDCDDKDADGVAECDLFVPDHEHVLAYPAYNIRDRFVVSASRTVFFAGTVDIFAAHITVRGSLLGKGNGPGGGLGGCSVDTAQEDGTAGAGAAGGAGGTAGTLGKHRWPSGGGGGGHGGAGGGGSRQRDDVRGLAVAGGLTVGAAGTTHLAVGSGGGAGAGRGKKCKVRVRGGHGGNGGAAIALRASRSLVITGLVDASGGHAADRAYGKKHISRWGAGGGGGAGGTILLQLAGGAVQLGSGARVWARGGDGKLNTMDAPIKNFKCAKKKWRGSGGGGGGGRIKVFARHLALAPGAQFDTRGGQHGGYPGGDAACAYDGPYDGEAGTQYLCRARPCEDTAPADGLCDDDGRTPACEGDACADGDGDHVCDLSDSAPQDGTVCGLDLNRDGVDDCTAGALLR